MTYWRLLSWHFNVVSARVCCKNWVETLKWFCYSVTAVLLRRQKGETASFHMLSSVCSKDRWPDAHLSPKTRRKKGFNHIMDAPTSPISNTPLLHFIIFFILFHLFKSLHFRCIHTFPISLCMSLPPSSPPPSLLPCFLSPSSSHVYLPFFLLSYLPPSIPLL